MFSIYTNPLSLTLTFISKVFRSFIPIVFNNSYNPGNLLSNFLFIKITGVLNARHGKAACNLVVITNFALAYLSNNFLANLNISICVKFDVSKTCVIFIILLKLYALRE